MEYINRQRLALQRAREQGADILLVTKLTHIRYLTGFTGTAGVLILGDEPLLVVDFRYGMQAQEQVVGVAVSGDCAPPKLWPTVHEVLRRTKGMVGIDLTNLTGGQYVALAEGSLRDRWVDCTNLVERIRWIKDDEELQALKDAAAMAEDLLDLVPGWLIPGRTENEIAGEVERAQRAMGAERSAAPILVSSGERSTLPHGAASSKLLAAGEPVLVDLSPVVRGYRADITRTFFIGTPSEEYRRLHRAILEAQDEAIASVRAGVPVRAVDGIARAVLARYGLDGYFKHSLGHGIGLDQHEPPLLSPYDDSVLEAGMVVMIEPGVYVPGVGGTRVEDAMLVTEDGCVPLGAYKREIIEL